MFTENTVLALVFAISTLIALLGMGLLARGDDDEDTLTEPARPLFGSANGLVAGMLPSTDRGRENLQQDLWYAGYPQPSALNNYLCIRNMLCVAPLVAGLASALFADDPRTGLTFGGLGILFSILGFALPRVMLAALASVRKSRMQQGMPTLMDTLALSMSSGVGLNEGLKRTAGAIRRGQPELAQELRTVNKQAELRSLDDALGGWKKRIPLPEVSSLVFLLTSSNRQGVEVREGLHELSSSYRTNIRQRAESAANRSNFYMVFPTVLCLLTAAGLMLAGPPIVEALSRSQALTQAFQEAQQRRTSFQDLFPKSGPEAAPAPAPAATAPPQL